MKKRRETLREFTERAVQATVDGNLIPPHVYVPVSLRKRAARLTEDDHVTVNPKTEAEITLQISKADPVGFLIAIMQGQPIPVFVVRQSPETKQSVEVVLELQTPDLKLRTDVAIELASRKGRYKKGDDQYEAMIARAAGLDKQTADPVASLERDNTNTEEATKHGIL